MLATEYAKILVKADRWFSAKCIIRKSKPRNSSNTKLEPTNPHSSPTVQKMKSVLCMGTYLYLVKTPWRNPFPINPPDPNDPNHPNNPNDPTDPNHPNGPIGPRLLWRGAAQASGAREGYEGH